MKRPLPDGTTHLLFTGLEFLRRVASLVPPPRGYLCRALRVDLSAEEDVRIDGYFEWATDNF